MLVTKFWDAINDPLIGALVDSHKTKEKENLFLGLNSLLFQLQYSVY